MSNEPDANDHPVDAATGTPPIYTVANYSIGTASIAQIEKSISAAWDSVKKDENKLRLLSEAAGLSPEQVREASSPFVVRELKSGITPVEFVVSAIVGGILYDLTKMGCMQLWILIEPSVRDYLPFGGMGAKKGPRERPEDNLQEKKDE